MSATSDRLDEVIRNANGNGRANGASSDRPPRLPSFRSASVLMEEEQTRRPVILQGFFRAMETVNLIGPSKARKSWLLLSMLLCIAAGWDWLGRFETRRGAVLLIDNELFADTLAYRIREVATALGIPESEYGNHFCIESLRGDLRDLIQLDAYFRAIEPGTFAVIALDAWYRLYPRGYDENSNADVVALYNLIDSHAKRLGAAFVVVHHAAKGFQNGKALTDVGAGAGAQSRAADAHQVLRTHEQEGVVVLEGVTRDLEPPQPLCMEWTFPVWRINDTLDPSKLRKPGKNGTDDADPEEPQWDVERFAKTFYTDKGKTKDEILIAAKLEGLSMKMAEMLHGASVGSGKVQRWSFGPKTKEQFATGPQPLFDHASKAPKTDDEPQVLSDAVINRRKPSKRKGKK